MYEDLATYLVSLETALLDARMRNPAKLAELLDDTYVEFGSSGMSYSRAEVIGAPKIEPRPNIKAQDFKVRELVPGIILITYRAIQDGTPEIHTLRSSTWQLWGGKWKAVFHQGTRIVTQP